MVAHSVVEYVEFGLITTLDDVVQDYSRMSVSSYDPQNLHVTVMYLTVSASPLQYGLGAGDLVVVRFAYLLQVVVHQSLDARLYGPSLLLHHMSARCHCYALRSALAVEGFARIRGRV